MKKAAVERERAELKLKMAKVRALAGTPLRVAVLTHSEMVEIVREIYKLASEDIEADV